MKSLDRFLSEIDIFIAEVKAVTQKIREDKKIKLTNEEILENHDVYDFFNETYDSFEKFFHYGKHITLGVNGFCGSCVVSLELYGSSMGWDNLTLPQAKQRIRQLNEKIKL